MASRTGRARPGAARRVQPDWPVSTSYRILIYDATTNTLICENKTFVGQLCQTTETQSVAATHNFIAYVATPGGSNPPSGIQATSVRSWVTWNTSGYETTGFLMKESSTSPCVLTFQPGVNGDNLVAFLTGNDQASSSVLFTVPDGG